MNSSVISMILMLAVWGCVIGFFIFIIKLIITLLQKLITYLDKRTEYFQQQIDNTENTDKE